MITMNSMEYFLKHQKLIPTAEIIQLSYFGFHHSPPFNTNRILKNNDSLLTEPPF